MPLEILLVIFSHLQPDAPTTDHDPATARTFVGTVAAVPLVCRLWRDAGREALYRFVDLTFASERACSRFLKSLARVPRLCTLVHGIALPRLDAFSTPPTPPTRRFAFLTGRNANPLPDVARLQAEILLRVQPVHDVHFPADGTTRDVVDSGALASIRAAHVGFRTASKGTVPVVPHLRHAHTLAISQSDPRTHVHFLVGTEQLLPDAIGPSCLATLHLANLVMPVSQWMSLLGALRTSGMLRQLVVRSFMLALSQGDGRDLLLPDDVLPVAGTLECLEVGTVLREPGALHMMPHLRSLSTHVAFPTVLPAPRALPRGLRSFRIVDDRRNGAQGQENWAWPVARFVSGLLQDMPPHLEEITIDARIARWDELQAWSVLAFFLQDRCAGMGVDLQINLRASDELTDIARSRWRTPATPY
ncbi:hypothetical protein BKA62DRAFT_777055 [Auriculariales sp. MPI-PUGE-AT-0066]|nr:hypothetical protein BKA62DRAFT_777055 [Auriculariales sp. MPI-PUGE-AT-0066]